MNQIVPSNGNTMTNEELVLRAINWYVTTPEQVRERQLEQLAKTLIATVAVAAIAGALMQE